MSGNENGAARPLTLADVGGWKAGTTDTGTGFGDLDLGYQSRSIHNAEVAFAWNRDDLRDRSEDGNGWEVLDPRNDFALIASGPETGATGRAKADEALAKLLAVGGAS